MFFFCDTSHKYRSSIFFCYSVFLSFEKEVPLIFFHGIFFQKKNLLEFLFFEVKTYKFKKKLRMEKEIQKKKQKLIANKLVTNIPTSVQNFRISWRSTIYTLCVIFVFICNNNFIYFRTVQRYALKKVQSTIDAVMFGFWAKKKQVQIMCTLLICRHVQKYVWCIFGISKIVSIRHPHWHWYLLFSFVRLFISFI